MKKFLCVALLLCFAVSMLASCDIAELYDYVTVISVEFSDIGDKGLFEKRLSTLAIEITDTKQIGNTVEYSLLSHYDLPEEAIYQYGSFPEVSIIDKDGMSVFGEKHTATYEYNGMYITVDPSDSFFDDYNSTADFKIDIDGYVFYIAPLLVEENDGIKLQYLTSRSHIDALVMIGLTSEPLNGDVNITIIDDCDMI